MKKLWKPILIGIVVGLSLSALLSFKTPVKTTSGPVHVAEGSDWNLYKVIDGANTVYILHPDNNGVMSISTIH